MHARVVLTQTLLAVVATAMAVPAKTSPRAAILDALDKRQTSACANNPSVGDPVEVVADNSIRGNVNQVEYADGMVFLYFNDCGGTARRYNCNDLWYVFGGC